ncbi:head maturation protease, ClpP-related [Oleidesulfovibrio sp.]|uniref:head maturation protease, ClpP-related n=1 Tax=Oleidesulfovibrio sp. TaxID=2909707 RepID=UPI003A8BEDF2
MNKFMQLLRDNAKASGIQPVKVEVQDKEATLYLYDVVVATEDEWWGGVGADAFVKALHGLADKEVIHIRINSPGGSVFAARAIEQAIREHPAKIIAHVDGYAASAASFIAVACDEVEMSAGGFFMIHKAWMCSCGNSDDFIQATAFLEKVDTSLIDTYAAESGQKAEDIAAWMQAETWFSAQEAVELGFADRIAEGSSTKGAAAKWNLAAYANAPKHTAQAEPPAKPAQDTVPAEQPVMPAANVEPDQQPDIAASAQRDHYLRRLDVAERTGR